jgi:peptide/nickel transport system permease protein
MATTHYERLERATGLDLRVLYLLAPIGALALTWGVPYWLGILNLVILEPLGLGIGTLDPFPNALGSFHALAMGGSLLLLHWALRRSFSPVIREYALPASILVAISFAIALESPGTRLPAGTFIELSWTHSRLFSWDVLGIALMTVALILNRRASGLPLVMPVSDLAREKSHLLFRRFRAIVKQLVENRMALVGIIILSFFAVVAIAGPFFFEFDLKTVGAAETQILPPSQEHPLGTDNFGHDILSKLVHGTRVSLSIGIFAAIISSFIGMAVGLASGYLGGWRDEALMRMNDVLLSLPTLLLLIMLAAIVGKLELVGIIVLIGITGWTFTSRVVRAQVLSVKERMFVERARAIGSGDMHIVYKHVFPNVFPLVFAETILTVSISIIAESSLAFLGLTADDAVSWGKVLDNAFDGSAWTNGLYGWILAPGFAIVLAVLGFSLLGYALDEILNPKLKRR